MLTMHEEADPNEPSQIRVNELPHRIGKRAWRTLHRETQVTVSYEGRRRRRQRQVLVYDHWINLQIIVESKYSAVAKGVISRRKEYFVCAPIRTRLCHMSRPGCLF